MNKMPTHSIFIRLNVLESCSLAGRIRHRIHNSTHIIPIEISSQSLIERNHNNNNSGIPTHDTYTLRLYIEWWAYTHAHRTALQKKKKKIVSFIMAHTHKQTRHYTYSHVRHLLVHKLELIATNYELVIRTWTNRLECFSLFLFTLTRFTPVSIHNQSKAFRDIRFRCVVVVAAVAVAAASVSIA